MLYIYAVKRNMSEDGDCGPEFDATHGFVIAAENEEEARKFASTYRKSADDDRQRNEDPEIWFEETTTVEIIGTANEVGKPGVILEDHQWGSFYS